MLREKIDRLLGAHSEAGTFLADPEFEPGDDTAHAPDIVTGEDGAERIGAFRLERELGQGGFGTVYLADQEKPVKRRVALKVIKLGMDTKQVIARFEAEKQAMAMMDHPNIATIYEAGATASGRPYFAMEYVEGEKITKFCDRRKLPVRERIELVVQICAAVTHAHQRGVIHRDIKPSNILVGGNGEPHSKIIDFGIAKATSQRLPGTTLVTELRHFLGTPAYVSPEQADIAGGADVDTRSDIYSLGVLLYELLTGSTPFDAKRLRHVSYSEVQRIIREELPPRPSARVRDAGERLTDLAEDRQTTPEELVRSLRGDLDWVVMKALEKDRDRRYESAAALGRDLQNYLGNRPVEAGPPDALYRLRKWVARNRLLATAASLLVVALVTAGVAAVVAIQASFRIKAANERARELLTRSQLEQVEIHFDQDQAEEALALLAKISRENPDRIAVHQRLASALAYRVFPTRVTNPHRHEAKVMALSGFRNVN